MGVKERFKSLFRPSVSWSVFTLVLIGLVVGMAGTVTFNATLAWTNTEGFCLSCHEMSGIPFATVQTTSHFNNKSGVRPVCADCHVPKAFIPKMYRKFEAYNDLVGHLLGTIDTPEKYQAHRQAMKDRELARLRASDSATCRSCHDEERMLVSQQTAKPQEVHLAMKSNGKTCVDCHAGIAHGPFEREPDQTALIKYNSLH